MNIQEILQSLKGTTIFSSLDACGAYHAVRIEPGSQACTAFISPFGTFQYIRMPFGLANSGSVYSWMFDVAMDKVEQDFWTSYLDDILTFSTGPRIYFGHLSQVVRVHAAAGIKIQPCKSRSQIGLTPQMARKWLCSWDLRDITDLSFLSIQR